MFAVARPYVRQFMIPINIMKEFKRFMQIFPFVFSLVITTLIIDSSNQGSYKR